MADGPVAASGSGQGGQRPPLGPVAFVAVLSFGHVLTMIGFSAFPALLPRFTELWSLSSLEGGIDIALQPGNGVGCVIKQVDFQGLRLVGSPSARRQQHACQHQNGQQCK